MFHHLFAALEKNWTSVSIFHFYSHRGGNCNCLLLNTVLLRSIDSVLLAFFQHRFYPCDVLELLVFRSSRFWLESFVI